MEYDWPEIIKFSNVTTAVVFSVVFVLGALGNGVVVWATGFRMKKTVTSVWYLNLAVANLLVVAFLPLKVAYRALDGHWPFGRFLCKADGLVFHMQASVYVLAVISVDRCVGVVCPLWTTRSSHRTVRKAAWVSLGVWAAALAPSIPHFVFRDTGPFGDDKVWCYDNYALVTDLRSSTPEEMWLYSVRRDVMVVSDFLLGLMVPFCVVVSCCSVVLCWLRNNRSQLSGRSSRSFKTLAAVAAAFFLCWIPYHVVQLIRACYDSGLMERGDTREVLLYCGSAAALGLALVNSCVNPLLYVYMSGGFRDAFSRGSSVLKVLEEALGEDPLDEALLAPTTPEYFFTTVYDHVYKIMTHSEEFRG